MTNHLQQVDSPPDQVDSDLHYGFCPEYLSAGPNRLYGWGRLAVPGKEHLGEDLHRLTSGAHLSRGLGRSYGDASLPANPSARVSGTVLADRIYAFDRDTLILRAEAGLSLGEISRIFWPKGYTCPTLPGTQYITLGGMVASDVHAKDHHVDGCFSTHVSEVVIRVASGDVVTCSPQVEADLFWATVGGMGLTGHILEVSVRLKRIPTAWVLQESTRVANIDDFLRLLEEKKHDWPYSVGWIDCLKSGANMGRGILMCGRWATPDEAPTAAPKPLRRKSIPIDFPSFLLNKWSVSVFNALYYGKHGKKTRRSIIHPDRFFHPLDAIRHWNRIYGKAGFTQYQCVVPRAAGSAGVKTMLKKMADLGVASFLCVIKDCKSEGQGVLSFPMEGVSIAMDLPVKKHTPAVIAALNDILITLGGRVYLAKDAFTSRSDFEAMEGDRLARWKSIRHKWDFDAHISSALACRLMGDHQQPRTNPRHKEG